MYLREIESWIVHRLRKRPAVAILGPRRMGKTTLAQKIARHQPSVYLDLEDYVDIQKLLDKDPAYYLKLHKDKLVILDEIQNFPEIFKYLRGIIDADQKYKYGRFLILGSASRDLIQQNSQSLSARIHYVELGSLNPLETSETAGKYLKNLWWRGGFPDSYGAESDAESDLWRSDFIRDYLRNDVPQFGLQLPAATLMNFWVLLAAHHGDVWSPQMAQHLMVSSAKANRYLDFMADLLLVRKLVPWAQKFSRQTTRSPRIYIRDSGVLHNLLGIKNYGELLKNPMMGKSWEGFVVENILSSLPYHVQPYYYRDAQGFEIDLLLRMNPGDFWAIEIKASSKKPKVKRGFYSACENLPVKRKFVIYGGKETYPLKDITVLSLVSFMKLLREFMPLSITEKLS